MNYSITGKIFSSGNLCYFDKDAMLFPGFYIYKDKGYPSGNTILHNYYEFEFVFYFSYNGEKFEYLGNPGRDLLILIQDNLEMPLSLYSLKHDTSIISRIIGSVEECGGVTTPEKQFYTLKTDFNKDFCWNYHVQNKGKDHTNYYDYKFRISNLHITPNTGMDCLLQSLIYKREFELDSFDEEILTQINNYSHGLFLEHHGMLSDAFNYFYKIVEIEEKNLRNIYTCKKEDLKKKLDEIFKINKQEINLELVFQKIGELKKETAKETRKEIFEKYGLLGKVDDFLTLGRIRGKFSHAKNNIDYVTYPKYINGKSFALQIILKKIEIIK